MSQTFQKQTSLIIKPSPFAFLKRLIVIELIFTFLGILITALVDFNSAYETISMSRYVTYNLLLAILFTTPQILIIAFTFLLWHFESYELDAENITHKFGGLFPGKRIAPVKDIGSVKVEQKTLGNYFNYGSIILKAKSSNQKIQLRNIPNPTYYAEKITALADAPKPLPENTRQQSALTLIADGEGQYIEFKSSFSWDYRQQKINKDLNKAVMKNVVGFMNTSGGVVLIGVDDDGNVLGLEPDFQHLRKKDADGFEILFNSIFNKMVGAEFRQYVAVDFKEYQGNIFCALWVKPTPEPIFLNDKNAEKFYIRTGNGSQPLTMRQAHKYIRLHFTE